MAATLEELVIKVSADLSSLKKQMRESTKVVKTSSDKMQKDLGSTIKTLVKWALVVQAGRMAIAQFRATISRSDEVIKLARNLNVATAELQAMQFAGRLAGVQAAQLNIAFLTMSRNLGLAAQGTGEAQASLKLLKINISDILKLSPDEQFKTIAEALAGIDDTATRAAVASRIFGESGQKLGNLMDGAREKIKSAKNELRKFGVLISESDEGKIEDLSDETLRLSKAWEGLTTSFVVEWSPAIIAAIGGIQKALTALKDAVAAVNKALLSSSDAVHKFEDVGRPLGELSEDAKRAVAELEELNKAVIATVAAMTPTVAPLEPLEDFMARINAEHNAKAKSIEQIAELENAASEKRIKGADKELEVVRATAEERTAIVRSTLADLTNALDTENRKQFQLSKALNVAEVVMNTSAAVTNILAKLGHRPVLAGSLITGAIATGALQLSKIRATSFGGGGSVGGGAAGGAVADGGGAVQDINVNIEGSALLGPEGLRSLFDGLNDVAADNVRPNFNVTVGN